jgi:hypothetical protein
MNNEQGMMNDEVECYIHRFVSCSFWLDPPRRFGTRKAPERNQKFKAVMASGPDFYRADNKPSNTSIHQGRMYFSTIEEL